MHPLDISPHETLKRFEFIEYITSPQDNFPKQVLASLTNTFGYKKAVFWNRDLRSSESQNNMNKAVVHNWHFHTVIEYLGLKDKHDPIFFMNYFEKLAKQKVYCYSDYFSLGDDKYDDFSRFLRKLSIKDVLVLILSNDSRRIGAISLYRLEDEDEFTRSDKDRLLFLSKYIANLAQKFNTHLQKPVSFKALKEFANLVSIGYIVTDSALNLYDYNAKSLEVCSRASKNKIFPLQEFTEQALFYYFHQHDGGNTISLPHMPDIQIRIVYLNDSDQYILFLIPMPSSGMSAAAQLLTEREMEVVNLLLRGLTYEEISRQLFISINTVKRHIQNVFKKLDVKNRTELGIVLRSII